MEHLQPIGEVIAGPFGQFALKIRSLVQDDRVVAERGQITLQVRTAV